MPVFSNTFYTYNYIFHLVNATTSQQGLRHNWYTTNTQLPIKSLFTITITATKYKYNYREFFVSILLCLPNNKAVSYCHYIIGSSVIFVVSLLLRLFDCLFVGFVCLSTCASS